MYSGGTLRRRLLEFRDPKLGSGSEFHYSSADNSASLQDLVTFMLQITRLMTLLLTLLASSFAGAERHSCAPDGIGAGGFDLLSYHAEGGPKQGLAEFTVQHEGLAYRFVDASNVAIFSAAPDKYLPVYQGWCATSLALGRLVCPDYGNYKLENGRLLVFELAGFTNGRTLWNTDPAGFRLRADANALKLLQ